MSAVSHARPLSTSSLSPGGPSGQIAAVCNEDNLCLVNAGSGAVTYITTSGPSTHDGCVLLNGVWSPGGTTLALTCHKVLRTNPRTCFVGKNHRLKLLATQWWTAEVRGWTPDSKRVVFWGRFSNSQPMAYHEETVDGSGLEPLPADAVVCGPSFSADGRGRLERTHYGNLALQPLSIRPRRVIFQADGADIWDWAFQPRP